LLAWEVIALIFNFYELIQPIRLGISRTSSRTRGTKPPPDVLNRGV